MAEAAQKQAVETVAAAEAEVEQVIKDQGLSRGRFEEILAYAQADDELAERVRQHLRQAR